MSGLPYGDDAPTHPGTRTALFRPLPLPRLRDGDAAGSRPGAPTAAGPNDAQRYAVGCPAAGSTAPAWTQVAFACSSSR